MIFSNTTPFISLCAINQINILPALFGRVHVVDAVVRECAAGGAILVPALDALDWITIVPSTTGIDPEPMLMQLDEGEKWTLHAARAAHAERLLIDEHIGRNWSHGRRTNGDQGHRHFGRIAQGKTAETYSVFFRGREVNARSRHLFSCQFG